MKRHDHQLTIIGAGLAGALLATLLARRGCQVRVFERRPDPRASGYSGGRSINLALSERGLAGLRRAGLEAELMAQAVMMRGRMIHEIGAEPYLQRYGRDDSEVIWSVGRGQLNLSLIDAAEAAGARFCFDAGLAAVDWQQQRLTVADAVGRRQTHEFTALIGADGAGSALRGEMQREAALGESIEPLGHGYKELSIPAAPGGGFRIEPHALHIWPRGGYMLIALPNVDASFTVTLFLPNQGVPSFASLTDTDTVTRFFREEFASALDLMPDARRAFAENPIGMLATLRLERWHLDGRAVLLGDAAHALVPFLGQGMNCAFEDCVELDQLLAGSDDLAAVFAEFSARRKPHADAIAAMAIENYAEMRDAVADDRFQLQKAIEQLLAERHPERFVPRYSMVSFRRIGYADARARGKLQAALLAELSAGIEHPEQLDLHHADQRVLATIPPYPVGSCKP
ncbi:MAG: FAD-dependent oxidoreductase [Lysobacterales bacterium]